ncbi:unnamed protein product [Mytilus edulis]|uniref:Ubiquitin-like protease family profile domain-containing protein n=1 Tax=Mytilus edulis TaxID=6550 RepID=A0A8S3Q3E4_MYTED|nr:unnamed protein product [Mytilus edulis]
MNTDTLRCIIGCDPVLSQQVIGIFAADEIPKKIPFFPIAFILNTDDRKQPRSHWLSIYLPSAHKAEFFDSYGHSPSFYSRKLQDVFNINQMTVIHNRKRLQSSYSNTCGYYCIFYLMCRCRKMEMGDIVKDFSHDYDVNDIYVSDLISNIFPSCL